MEVGLTKKEKEKKKKKMGFEETELRLGLGLPGNGATASEGDEVVVRKRGFSHTQPSVDVDVDLMLNLSSKETSSPASHPNTLPNDNTLLTPHPPKAQVVGWPPVRSFRKKMQLAVQKSNGGGDHLESSSSNGAATFVKVSMDGAPYLRKVDLSLYNTYQQLSDSLANMFSSFTIGNCGSQGMKDFMNENKLMDILNGSDYVPTYEDKDGDWMLVGDVPWEMFVESCKRLRIMKGKEAIGLAPRAMEKCKNRS